MANSIVTACALIALCTVNACREHPSSSGPTENPGGLLHAISQPTSEQPAAIDVPGASSSVAELMRALALTHQEVGELLGSHVFSATSSAQVNADLRPDPTDPANPHSTALAGNDTPLVVEARIEYMDKAHFRTVVDNSADYGRETIYIEPHLYLKQRYGKFHRRSPTTEQEPAELRDRTFAELRDYLALVAHMLQVRDGGVDEYLGRPVRKVHLELASAVADADSSADSGGQSAIAAQAQSRAWRQQLQVESLTGTIHLDNATGIALRATMEAKARSRRDKVPIYLELSVDHRIIEIGVPVEIASPPEEDWVSTPTRTAEAQERSQLLRGIAQPARAAPTPKNPRGNPKRAPSDSKRGNRPNPSADGESTP